MSALAEIRKRYFSSGLSDCYGSCRCDVGTLLAMVTDGPPLPPEAVLHDAASAMDVARACFANDQREEGLAELKRATALLRSLVATP
jgi:hypothetical protein